MSFFVLTAAWAGTAAVQAAPSITALSGSAFVHKAGTSVWQPASRGWELSARDQVRTGSGAHATIVFDDGSHIELGPNASFTMQEASSDRSTLNLAIGSLRAWVSKSLSRRFEVRTPTAVCSVRGTEFSVDVNAQGHTVVQMFSGVLAVADNRGNEAVVRDRESLRVTDAGIGSVQTKSGSSGQTPTVASGLKAIANHEVGLEMSKEQVQAAAAIEAMNAVYKEGKAIIDVSGNRVRIEDYIVRSAPNQFKLVILNEREARFDYFYYHGVFNQVLPDDISIALRQMGGCIGSPCPYFMTSYDTARSNTQDNMLEMASGGHQIDVNHDGNAADAVTSAFDRAANSFVTLAPGTVYFQTLFDYNRTTFNGVPHSGWVPANPLDAIANGGLGIANYGAKINTGSVLRDMNDPASAFSPASLTTLQYYYGPDHDPAGAAVPPLNDCTPPDCTYDEPGIIHSVQYAQSAVDPTVWEKYDNYLISDEGKVAGAGEFLGMTRGTPAYNEKLLKWNYETIVTASEFGGRKIDLAVEPKILLESGLIQ